MRTSTRTGRAAAALATIALAGLVTVTPAQAESRLLDDGVLTPAEVKVWENESSTRSGGPGRSPADTLVPRVDETTIEYLQVALGAIGGMVVAGAVAAGVVRRQGPAHPA